jgi:hypothetical protein
MGTERTGPRRPGQPADAKQVIRQFNEMIDLECLTKRLFQVTPTDEGTAELKESLMDVQSSFIAYGQPAEAVEPCEGAFHDPAVPSQLLAAFDASPGDTRSDASFAKSGSISFGVVPFISMHLVRSLAWPTSCAPKGRDGIDHLLQHRCVCYIGSRTLQRQRYPSSADHKMALRAWFALIRRVLACCLFPFFTPLALTVCESKEALDQSISPSWLRVSSSSLCNFSHTPAFSQSRRRRQHVIPDPQPISWGSISHCKPDLSTNTMPVSAARFGMRGLPPFGLGGSGGKSGSIISHNSSGINGFAMPNFTKSSQFC